MLLHANAVAQNRAAGVGAGGIDGDDADRRSLLAIVVCQLIDQRALARAGRAGEPEYPRLAAVRKQGLQQLRPSRRVILDGGDGARQRAGIAGAELMQSEVGNCLSGRSV